MSRMLTGLLLIFTLNAASASSDERETGAAATPAVRLNLKMHGASDVSLQRADDGSYRYLVTDEAGTHELTPQQFAERLYQDHALRSFLRLLFNITKPIAIAWVTLGFLGQALFTGRMILQWIITERRGRSTVPVAFWWMSLAGGVMLLTYFIWRKDIVGVIGQSTGVFIYSRNLILIYRRRHVVQLAQQARLVKTSSDSEEPEIELQSS